MQWGRQKQDYASTDFKNWFLGEVFVGNPTLSNAIRKNKSSDFNKWSITKLKLLHWKNYFMKSKSKKKKRQGQKWNKKKHYKKRSSTKNWPKNESAKNANESIAKKITLPPPATTTLVINWFRFNFISGKWKSVKQHWACCKKGKESAGCEPNGSGMHI